MILLSNPHYVVEPLFGARIIRVTRQPTTFATQESVDLSCGQVMLTLDRFGRATSCVLIDSRAAPGRNDPEFERWFSFYRRGMLLGFVRAAVLVTTAVGKLQSDRLVRQDAQAEDAVRVFNDEAIALAWLREGLASPNGPNAV